MGLVESSGWQPTRRARLCAVAAAWAIGLAAASVHQAAWAQESPAAATQTPPPAAAPAPIDTFDADMKSLPQPPADAALPQVEPVIPDDQFKDAVPEFTPAEQNELNTPLESIEEFERRLDAKPAPDTAAGTGKAKGAATDHDKIAASPLGDQNAAEAVPDAPLGDAELLQPLPPLQSFQVEPVEITGEDAAKPADKIGYAFEIDGLDKADAETDADLRGLFNDVSTLKDGGGEAANISQIYARAQHAAELLNQILASEGSGYSKKERLNLDREREKLDKALGGIRNMGGVPDLMVVIDTNKEKIAIDEANRLGIPVAAVVDSNCDPDHITYPIPGNDDAARAIQLYCDLMADAILDGLAAGQAASGVDLGASEAPMEPALARSAVSAATVEAEVAPAEAAALEAEMSGQPDTTAATAETAQGGAGAASE